MNFFYTVELKLQNKMIEIFCIQGTGVAQLAATKSFKKTFLLSNPIVPRCPPIFAAQQSSFFTWQTSQFPQLQQPPELPLVALFIRSLRFPITMRTLLSLRSLQSSPPPCLTSNFHFSSPSCTSFLYSFRPNRRFHFLSPCSSLKQTKKQQTLQKTDAPQSLRWFLNPKGGGGGGAADDDKVKGDGETEGGLQGDTAVKGTLLAGVLLVGVVGGFAAVGYIYKDQINAFLNQFSGFIEGNCLNFLFCL